MAVGLEALLGAFGISLPTSRTVVSARTVLVSAALGVIVTVASVLGPARRATKVLPVEALREEGEPAGPSRPRRALAGGVVTGLGALGLVLGLFGGGSAAAGLVGTGAVLVLLGVALLGPLVARPLSRAIGSPMARFRGLAGRLARENAMRNPARTSATAAALMIGLALVTFVSVFAASATSSANHAIDRAFTADYLVTSRTFSSGLSARLADDLRATPGIARVARIRPGAWKLDGSTKGLSGVEPSDLAAVSRLRVSSGTLPGPGEGGLLVSEKVADEHHWRPGDLVPMEFSRTGVQRIRLAAVFAKNDLLKAIAGSYLLALPDYERNLRFAQDGTVLVKAAPGESPAASRRAIDALLERYPNAKVEDEAELKADQRSQVNQTLGLITALLFLAVLIAVLGIVNTLALSVFERRRELGLLRVLGMTRRQVRSMIRWEAVIIAVLGAFLGLAVGLVFGWALVASLRDQGTSEFVAPVGRLVGFLVFAALAGMAAALLPARRAARTDVLTAIAYE
jgi:putative ABC transport system permease protein